MFDGPTIDDMKVRPSLNEHETVVFITGTTLGDVVRNNVIIAVTTDRIIVRPKRGRNVDQDLSERANLELGLEDIDVLRRTGAVTKSVEVICNETVQELPPIQNDFGELIDAITSQAGLGKTSWGEEGTAKRGTKQFAAGIVGILGLVIGGLFAILGIAGIISIAGILLGIPFLIGGLVISYASVELIKWAFNKEEEWDRSTPIKPDEPKISQVDFGDKFTNRLGYLKATISEGVPVGIWSHLVLLGSLLWLSLFVLLENDSIFGVVLFTAWVLLPLSIYLDTIEVRQNHAWNPKWYLYVLLSLIPIAGSIFGFVWLARKRQKTGSAFR